MDQKLITFLENAKSNEKHQRDMHLISLGLTDENKISRKYIDFFAEGAKYDTEKKLYYREIVGAIDVTDEEYAEVCKYSYSGVIHNDSKDSAEKTLRTIATVTLIIGIILSIIVLGISFSGFPGAPALIIAAIAIFISSLISWAVLKVFCNISLKLSSIENKLK